MVGRVWGWGRRAAAAAALAHCKGAAVERALARQVRLGVTTNKIASRPIGLPATCQLQSIAKPLSVDANAVP